MSPNGGRKGVLKELRRADGAACDDAASFLQSGFWGAFKARFGWEALAFRAVWENGEVKPLLVLRRSLLSGPLGRGISLAYIPWGPELPSEIKSAFQTEDLARRTALTELAEALKKLLPKDTAFIRFDPPWYSEELNAFSPPLPFTRSGADIQPPDTVLISLKEPMESILAGMKPKWRYNARLALKKGVKVRRAGVEEIAVFYDLLKETAGRDGIAIHGVEYYRTLLENTRPDIRLYLAEHEGDTLAGIVTLYREREAVYLYGASSEKKRSLMAPYALQVKAMEDAKEAGCEEYDLFGIPPDDDPSHPMAGLYRFKTGFGGRIIHRPGSWDFPCHPLLYRLFRGAESFRKKLRTMKKAGKRSHTKAESVGKQ